MGEKTLVHEEKCYWQTWNHTNILSTAYESGIKLTNLMVICIVCVDGGKSSYHLHVLKYLYCIKLAFNSV